MTEEQRKRRAAEWKRFAEGDGGLFEMLDELRENNVGYLEDEAKDVEDFQMAVAELRAIQFLRAKVQAVINTGKVDIAEQEKQAARAAGTEKAFH